ncbi:MAG TPA: hypothetical protein VFA20_25470 [Myxococcaceae bacterium]|nr:hypothetical protein [Myxococcaceae bacterium]
MKIPWLSLALAAAWFAFPSQALAQADAGVPAAAPADGGTRSPEDEALMKEIEAASAPAAKPASGAAPAAATEPPKTDGAAAPKGAGGPFSNLYNPAMSLNGLFLGSFTTQDAPADDQAHTGVAIQEVELQVLANVDPFLSANVILSVPGGKGVEVEEGYLSLTAQPLGIAFRGGKLKLPFGRENPQHTHALPFVDRSLVGQAVFGDEGLSEVGVEGSYLLPLPWYLLLTASVMNGDNEVAFHSPEDRDLAAFAALKSVVDVTDDATLELGASYSVGRNADRLTSQAAGGHLVVKWKPAAASTTHSAVLTLEGLYSRVPKAVTALGNETDTYGAYAYAQWQLERQWYIGARVEFVRPAAVVPDMSRRESAILVFAPTEFSAVRLQGSATQPGGGAAPFYEAFLQVNFTLGAHPAHSY